MPSPVNGQGRLVTSVILCDSTQDIGGNKHLEDCYKRHLNLIQGENVSKRTRYIRIRRVETLQSLSAQTVHRVWSILDLQLEALHGNSEASPTSMQVALLLTFRDQRETAYFRGNHGKDHCVAWLYRE